MRNNKGITLTEVLVTLAILSIISSIAIVNYGSTQKAETKNQLIKSAKTFSVSVVKCIIGNGGWDIKLVGGRSITPCRVAISGHTSQSDIDKHKNSLKKKIEWDCPGDQCFGSVGKQQGKDKFFCVDIRKEVMGTKYQVAVHFDIEKQADTIYYGTPQSYEHVRYKCNEVAPVYGTNLSKLPEGETKWPEPSSTPPPSGDPNNSG